MAKPSQLEFTGTVLGESAMKSETEIGSQIDYEFRVNTLSYNIPHYKNNFINTVTVCLLSILKVINLGKPLKSFGTAYLNIMWPKNTATQKWLLYLMKITTTGTDKTSCKPDEVNKLRLTEVSHTSDYWVYFYATWIQQYIFH